MTRLLVVALVCIVQTGISAFEERNQGSRASAMGGSLVASTGYEWSAFINPAALQTTGGMSLSFSYVPQPFGLKELSHGAISIVEPTGAGAFALSGSRIGFELYKETRLALSYGNELAGLAKGGMTLNYYSLSIPGYGTASAFGIDAGVLIDISGEVRWGFAAFNLNAPAIGVSKEKLPQVFSTGIAFDPLREATLAASLVKDVRYPAELHIGIEYTLLEILALRAGTTSDPSTINAGVGIHYSFVRFDYAFSSHSALGATHQFSLSVNIEEI